MQLFKRLGALLLCGVTLCTGLQTLAAEESLNVRYVKIDQEEFVADTLNGVEARYNLYGETYYCTELVERYYKEIYGLTVAPRPYGGPQVVGRSDYWFEPTDTPKTGDVLFGAAAARGKDYNHWAIVESYDAQNDLVTIFEQNWRWNGQAGIGRQMHWSDSVYRCYTLCCADGEPEGDFPAADRISDWALEAVSMASQIGVAAYGDGYQEPVPAAEFATMLSNLTAQSADTFLEAMHAAAADAVDPAQATAGLQKAYTILSGTGAALPPVLISTERTTTAMTAQGIEVPASAAAVSGALTREQAIALSIWLCDNTDFDLAGMHEAMNQLRSQKELEAGAPAVACVVNAAFDNMYLSRTQDYYTKTAG